MKALYIKTWGAAKLHSEEIVWNENITENCFLKTELSIPYSKLGGGWGGGRKGETKNNRNDKTVNAKSQNKNAMDNIRYCPISKSLFPYRVTIRLQR